MIRRAAISEDTLKSLPSLVRQGYSLGNAINSDLCVFAYSKNSLSQKGQAVLFFLLENEFVQKTKEGMIVFTQKAMNHN